LLAQTVVIWSSLEPTSRRGATLDRYALCTYRWLDEIRFA